MEEAGIKCAEEDIRKPQSISDHDHMNIALGDFVEKYKNEQVMLGKTSKSQCRDPKDSWISVGLHAKHCEAQPDMSRVRKHLSKS